jgi:hypothetical protein
MKQIKTILFTCAIIICAVSCKAKQSNESYAMETVALSAISGAEAPTINEQIEIANRKIIKTGSIRFEVADLDKTKSLISQEVQKLNGYIEKEYSDQISQTLTLRIPADKFDLFLENISKNIDKLEHKDISVSDVTDEYIDIDARIKTKKELQNKYTELLKQAKTVAEILNIEKEIGNLQTEIESVEGRMKYLKDQIMFSTLTVTYYKDVASEFDFSDKFINGIKNGWTVFLWFVVGLSNIWIFILIATTLTTCLIIKRRKNKNRKQVS